MDLILPYLALPNFRCIIYKPKNSAPPEKSTLAVVLGPRSHGALPSAQPRAMEYRSRPLYTRKQPGLRVALSRGVAGRMCESSRKEVVGEGFSTLSREV